MSEPNAKTEEAKPSRARRDQLRAIEVAMQAQWEEKKVFEADAPSPDSEEFKKKYKFVGCFPYPYMNGRLHLGHCFTLTKVEFAAGFERLQGKHVLFPFGFHCTGMPIKACADKLRFEIESYGIPPKWPEPKEPEGGEEDVVDPKDPAKFVSKKSKAAFKKGGETHQWDIVRSIGVPEPEVPSFADPIKWLRYFPPIGKLDLQKMGCRIDWRRSFITTDVNPFYDSFIRWQFETLRKQGRILFGKRYTIYSPKDGQPCADHDRKSGEGVQPQEYVLIKMQVNEPYPAALAALAGRKVFLGAATLRAETMYGQTNCWVLPEGEYGAFEMPDGSALIISERAARNLAFQDYSPEYGVPRCLVPLRGTDLIGLPLSAPNAVLKVVYALPMLTIKTTKGTGIVTSVPSDAPDDYAALLDLKNKPKLREKYGVKDEWVLPFEPIPIIDVPGYGNLAAVVACEQHKIKSQNDSVQLQLAKEEVYKAGFYEGVMAIGPHKGIKVSDAKPLIKNEMIEAGQAIKYNEPEKQVISRSEDECVVALCDQWYLNYGEDEWKAKVKVLVDRMEFYHVEVRNQFVATLDWLRDWACSRSFGLGTRLPWDTKFVIESLSDSTIYMAYYAVAHILQGGVIDGSAVSAVRPEHLTNEVWDHVMCGAAAPAGCPIPAATLARMRAEVAYWYPVDVRVSGKDLVQNHLTFFLFNHVAMFKEEWMWPRSIRANGHLLMNSEKMSKSTGNFMTLSDAVDEYSADGMRFALADAGDGLDDANFLTDTANAGILRLTTFLGWIQEVLTDKTLREAGGEPVFADRAFEAEINHAVHTTKSNYERMLYREALKSGFYEFQAARDAYRMQCAYNEVPMRRDLLHRYIECQLLLLAPVCPHLADHCWQTLLGKPSSIMLARWPEAAEADHGLLRAGRYLKDVSHALLNNAIAARKPKKGSKDPVAITRADVYVAAEFPDFQLVTLRVLAGMYTPEGFPADLMNRLMAVPELKADSKRTMPYAKWVKDEVDKRGREALETSLPFSELEVLTANRGYVAKTLQVTDLQIYAANAAPSDPGNRASAAQPTKPSAHFS